MFVALSHFDTTRLTLFSMVICTSSAKDLCCVDKFAEWEAAGVQVVPVISQPDDTWNGRAGYVQTALEEDGVQIPRNSAALLCGMKGMTENVKELLTKAGVFEGRIMFNF